jgi:hypothetical protein
MLAVTETWLFSFQQVRVLPWVGSCNKDGLERKDLVLDNVRTKLAPENVNCELVRHCALANSVRVDYKLLFKHLHRTF